MLIDPSTRTSASAQANFVRIQRRAVQNKSKNDEHSARRA